MAGGLAEDGISARPVQLQLTDGAKQGVPSPDSLYQAGGAGGVVFVSRVDHHQAWRPLRQRALHPAQGVVVVKAESTVRESEGIAPAGQEVQLRMVWQREDGVAGLRLALDGL